MTKASKKLKIILPIVILALISIILIIVLIPKGVTAEKYFNSLNAKYTKQVQNTKHLVFLYS